MCQLCKSFQQGSPEALQQPLLCAGDGRLGWICLQLLQLLPAPDQARNSAPAPWHLHFAEGVSLLGSELSMALMSHGSADTPWL